MSNRTQNTLGYNSMVDKTKKPPLQLTQPPTRPLVLLANLFDALAIICFRRSCDGVETTWRHSHPQFVVVDGDAVDKRHGLNSVWMHGIRNAVSHGEAVILVRRNFPGTRHILLLEADYIWLPNASTSDSAVVGLRRFVAMQEWKIVRLGYNPIGESDKSPPTHKVSHVARLTFEAGVQRSCPKACRCEIVAGTSGKVCQLTRRSDALCDIRSMVAYALHGVEAFDRIIWLRNESLRRGFDAKYELLIRTRQNTTHPPWPSGREHTRTGKGNRGRKRAGTHLMPFLAPPRSA